MSAARRSAVVLIMGAFLIAPPVVAAQWIPTVNFTTFAPANDVRFTVSPESPSYGTGDVILMYFLIENVGSRPLFVPHGEEMLCPPKTHVNAWFASADGHYGGGSGGGASCGQSAADRDPTHEQRRGPAEAR